MKHLYTVTLFLFFIASLYLFLVGIHSLSDALTLLNHPFAQSLFSEIKNPFVGFFVGILVTAIMQSSSATNALAITMVSTQTISLEQVIPIIMGANIGTTVTNTLVAISTIFRTSDFKRAFAASTVHDFFNIITAAILFPLELYFHIIQKLSLFLYHMLLNNNIQLSTEFKSPIKVGIEQTTKLFSNTFSTQPALYALFSIALIFLTITLIIKILKFSFLQTMKQSLHKDIFTSPLRSWSIGAFFTSIVQSSSITTSLVIPLASEGILTLEQIYPYTVGANMGTGVTTFIAALSLNRVAFVAAIATLCFDIIGSCVIYPMPIIGDLPLWLSKNFAIVSSKYKIVPIIYLLVLFIFLPLMIIFF